MKTTIMLPDRLHREAKKAAAERGITLGALIQKALECELEPTEAPKEKFKLKDGSFKGKLGLQPGIDFSNWDQIRSLIYEGHGG